jgi:hypothetical protein
MGRRKQCVTFFIIMRSQQALSHDYPPHRIQIRPIKSLISFRTLICFMVLYLSAARSILVRRCPPVQRKCRRHGLGLGLGKVLIRVPCSVG